MTEQRPIIILHGWNSTSQSFERLAGLLRTELHRDVSIISLADYVSLEDEVRFDDLTTAMQAAWKRHRLPRCKGGVDAIVHSTGGLVIRDSEFPANPDVVGHDVTYEMEASSGSTAFGVMDTHNHASITLAPTTATPRPTPICWRTSSVACRSRMTDSMSGAEDWPPPTTDCYP